MRRAKAVAVVRRAAGLCLEYPGPQVLELLPVLRAAVAECPGAPGAAAVAAFAAELAGLDPVRAGERYVATFDTRNRRSLYLTWWADGDTRRRGGSLVALKDRYRRHGFEVRAGELPDFLPVVLEYAGSEPRDGTALLREHAGCLDRMAAGLAGTEYAPLVAAVRETLPRRAVRLPVPPAGTELVGLELPAFGAGGR